MISEMFHERKFLENFNDAIRLVKVMQYRQTTTWIWFEKANLLEIMFSSIEFPGIAYR